MCVCLYNIAFSPTYQMLPSLICHTQEMSEERVELRGMIKQLQLEQEKLSALIPLSAAASGTIAGERQLQILEQRVADKVVDELQKRGGLAPSDQHVRAEGTGAERHGRFLLHSWGGKLRGVPVSFSLDRACKLTTLWRKWWIGEPGNCMPYRIVFASYKSDMQAALEFENEDDANLKKKKQILRATMNEHTKVMEHITSFASSEHLTALHGYNAADLRTKVAFQEEIQLTWNALWPKYEQQVGFAAVWRGVTQGGKSGKRRQHDLKRTTVRTAYRLYLDQKKYIESQ